MADNGYTLDQLAVFAREGHIPSFMYAKYESAERLLKGYPRSLRYSEAWDYLILLSMTIMMIVDAAFFVVLLNRGISVTLSALGALAVVIPIFILFNYGLVKSKKRYWDRESVINLSKQLYDIAQWSGYEPDELTSLALYDRIKLGTRIMVEACKIVIVCQEQNADKDPTSWRDGHSKLMREVRDRYDTVTSLGLIKGDGYGPFYGIAKCEIEFERV